MIIMMPFYTVIPFYTLYNLFMFMGAIVIQVDDANVRIGLMGALYNVSLRPVCNRPLRFNSGYSILFKYIGLRDFILYVPRYLTSISWTFTRILCLIELFRLTRIVSVLSALILSFHFIHLVMHFFYLDETNMVILSVLICYNIYVIQHMCGIHRLKIKQFYVRHQNQLSQRSERASACILISYKDTKIIIQLSETRVPKQ